MWLSTADKFTYDPRCSNTKLKVKRKTGVWAGGGRELSLLGTEHMHIHLRFWETSWHRRNKKNVFLRFFEWE